MLITKDKFYNFGFGFWFSVCFVYVDGNFFGMFSYTSAKKAALVICGIVFAVLSIVGPENRENCG